MRRYLLAVPLLLAVVFYLGPRPRPVVAVSCTSRFEMFGGPDAAPEGELRFRNPSHAAAKHPGLAPAILSSV